MLRFKYSTAISYASSPNGFQDTTNYEYADQDVGPFNDAFRRVVVSKTVYLRNARPAS